MASIWSRVLDEAARAARQAPRIFLAPFLGAAKETHKVFNEIQRENRAPRAVAQAGEPKSRRGAAS